MKPLVGTIAAVVLLVPATLLAQPPATMYSSAFYATAPCDGQDHVTEFDNNSSNYAEAQGGTVYVVGCELTIAQSSGTLQYAICGNHTTHDVMLFMGQGMSYSQNWFPSGFAMPIAPGDYSDIHISCTGGAGVTALGFETIHYVLGD